MRKYVGRVLYALPLPQSAIIAICARAVIALARPVIIARTGSIRPVERVKDAQHVAIVAIAVVAA